MLQASQVESIVSFTQLSQSFVNHFKTGKSVKKPKSLLFIVRQGQNESLKYCITRFSVEALLIDGGNNDLSLSAMMLDLKLNKLLWSIAKNDPKDFQDLLTRAKKYVNVEELVNSQPNEGLAKFGEKRNKGPEK